MNSTEPVYARLVTEDGEEVPIEISCLEPGSARRKFTMPSNGPWKGVGIRVYAAGEDCPVIDYAFTETKYVYSTAELTLNGPQRLWLDDDEREKIEGKGGPGVGWYALLAAILVVNLIMLWRAW